MDENAVACPVLGTEDGQVFVLNPSNFAAVVRVQLPTYDRSKAQNIALCVRACASVCVCMYVCVCVCRNIFFVLLFFLHTCCCAAGRSIQDRAVSCIATSGALDVDYRIHVCTRDGTVCTIKAYALHLRLCCGCVVVVLCCVVFVCCVLCVVYVVLCGDCMVEASERGVVVLMMMAACHFRADCPTRTHVCV